MDRKITKAAAKYQAYPKGLKKCRNCSMFVRREPANGCTLVQGEIQSYGYCIHHEAKK